MNCKSYSIIIVVIALISCKTTQITNKNTTTFSNTSINDSIKSNTEVENLIAPYKKELDTKMNTVLVYTPIDLTKEGYNSPLANMMCDVVLERTKKTYNQPIDMCLMNSGGLRRTFAKGPITTGQVFELLPFENSVVVATIKGSDLPLIISYLKKFPKGHPISGAVITINKNGQDTFTINGQEIDPKKNYRIVTNDYLAKGGDNMSFFSKASTIDDTQIKLRDLFIKYFTEIDTLHVATDKRLILE